MPRPAAGVKPAREPATFRHGFHCTSICVLVIANHDIRPLLLEPARLIKARPARAVTLASHRPISKSWRGQVMQNTEPLRRPRGCSMTASARHPLARGRGGGDGGDRRRRCTLLGLCCYILLSQATARKRRPVKRSKHTGQSTRRHGRRFRRVGGRPAACLRAGAPTESGV